MTHSRLAAALAALLVLAVAPADAQQMKIAGIPGTSKAPGHANWIDIVSVSTPLNPKTTPSGPGTLRIRKLVDSATPLIQQARSGSKSIATVTLDMPAKAGEQVYLSIKLENVQITSYQTSAALDGRPTEEVAFYYNRISFNYASTPGH